MFDLNGLFVCIDRDDHACGMYRGEPDWSSAIPSYPAPPHVTTCVIAFLPCACMNRLRPQPFELKTISVSNGLVKVFLVLLIHKRHPILN
jgi:hypothetical protein